MKFEDFGLTPNLLKAIENEGFITPTPIQQKVIPLILEGRDVVGQANTGTGKTAAFGLPALSFLEKNPREQMLILTPVRELTLQVRDELAKYGKGCQMATIYGGQSYREQIMRVKQGVQIIVATPGRLLDLLETDRIPNFQPSLVVLDEADEMLDMGFLDDIKKILSNLQNIKQTLLFSATMPGPIKQLAKTFLKDPAFIHVEGSKKPNEDIDQYYCILNRKEKEDALVRLLDTEDSLKSIVFCSTKKEVDHLSSILEERQHSAFALHGDMQQSHRQKIMTSFRKSPKAILVATEVAGRGLNVENVTHVFNYDVPHDSENYIHRIGRTGRAGNKGISITLVTPGEKRGFERICKIIGSKLEHLPIPDLNQAKSKKSTKLLHKLKDISLHKEAPEIAAILREEMDTDEILHRLLTLVLKKEKMTGPDQIGLSIKEWNKQPSKEWNKRPSKERNKRPSKGWNKKPSKNLSKNRSFNNFSKGR